MVWMANCRLTQPGSLVLSMFFRLSTLLLLLCFAAAALAQSGRVKKKEDKDDPKPKTDTYNPTQKVSPTPTPDPNKRPRKVEEDGDDDSDAISFDATLVPIPVSVINNADGRALTSLRLEDFLLSVDGSPVSIGELFRSESPVRLALLFDNSSSVTVAREFEQKAAIRFFRRVIRPQTDLAALYSVAGVTQLEQPLTKDVRLLINAIRGLLPPEGATSLHDGIIEASNYLQEQNGRRVIVIVSDGQDTLSDASFDKMVESRSEEQLSGLYCPYKRI